MNQNQQYAIQALYTQYGGGTLSTNDWAVIGPLVDSRNDSGITTYLNGITPLTTTGSVSNGTLLGWTAGTGVQEIIEDTANTPGSTYYATQVTVNGNQVSMRSMALSMLRAQMSGTSFILDNSQEGASNKALLSLWVAEGAMTQPMVNELIAMATAPNPIPLNVVSNTLNGVLA